ncbi:MAG TPA: hypothetical protein HA326_05060 [Thermoplasmata archaeon]|nr:hypothetical protein [Thermoplasmata archaeon]
MAVSTGGSVTPWIVALAGLADGFNPCSFAGLLVFASVTTAAFERDVLDCHSANMTEAAPQKRRRIVRNGAVYIAGLFATYMALGLGLLSAMNLLTEGHWIGKAAALMSIGMGLWILRDGLFPESRWKLEMPRFTRPRVHKAFQATFVPAVFTAGVLVGLCTVPCTGGIYLGVLALLSAQGAAGTGFGLLVLYNVMFIVPLVAVLVLVTSRPTYRAVARWHLRTKNLVKLALGGVMLALGLFTLLILT